MDIYTLVVGMSGKTLVHPEAYETREAAEAEATRLRQSWTDNPMILSTPSLRIERLRLNGEPGRESGMIETSLHIAEYVIRAREAFDNPAGAEYYDISADPEGHIASILIALMHHCRKHGHYFDDELERARGHFDADLIEEPDSAGYDGEHVNRGGETFHVYPHDGDWYWQYEPSGGDPNGPFDTAIQAYEDALGY